jgi:hypothetical protein
MGKPKRAVDFDEVRSIGNTDFAKKQSLLMDLRQSTHKPNRLPRRADRQISRESCVLKGAC